MTNGRKRPQAVAELEWYNRLVLLQFEDIISAGVCYDRCSFLVRCVLRGLIPPSSACIEIGVERGNFSNAILEIFEPKKLFLVDPWDFGDDKNSTDIDGAKEVRPHFPDCHADFRHVAERFSEEIQCHRIEQIREYSYDAVDLFDDNFFDFIYIDATHTYGSVKADLHDWWPKLKPSGLMAGHDYGGSHLGLIAAVDEFIKEYDLHMNITAHSAATDWGIFKK